MTDSQINQAIAEACGIVGKDQYGPLYQTPEGWVVDCPQFCTDLNAMAEAEKVLVEEGVNMWWCYVDFINRHNPTRLGRETAVHATARQRAEAFLLTLGKWSATDKESLIVGATTEQSSAVQSTSSGGSGGASTYGGKGLGIAGAAWPPETRITVNGKTFRLADIDKEMIE